MENLIKHCQCAAGFRCLISKTELTKLMQTFLTLADKFHMYALHETVTQILQLC